MTGEPSRFSEIEVNFAVAVAEQGGIAIQNAISYQRISKLVTELEHQEDFLQSVMDSLYEDLFVLDAHHRITMVNRTFLKNHRVTETDILGKPCHKVIRACAHEHCPFENGRQLSGPNGNTRRTQAAEGDKHLEIITSPVSIFDQEGKVDIRKASRPLAAVKE